MTEVNQLVQRFEQAAKMMKTVAKGGVPQVPGMGPIPGGSYAGKKKQVAAKKGSKSGNPAKRAAENAALSAAAKARRFGGSGFGLGKGPAATTGPREEELAALQKMLGR